jgi:hypothetical protein
VVHRRSLDVFAGMTSQRVVHRQFHPRYVGKHRDDELHQSKPDLVSGPRRGVEKPVITAVLTDADHSGSPDHPGDGVFRRAQYPASHQGQKPLETRGGKAVLKAYETEKEVFW